MPLWNDRSSIGEFPNEADRKRVKHIHEMRALWQAKHEEIYTKIDSTLRSNENEALKKKWAGLRYVTCNLLGLLSRDTAEHIALQPSTIMSSDAQDAVDELRKRSGWDAVLLDIIESASALGEAPLKIYQRADGDGFATVLDYVDPDLVFRGEDYFDEYRAIATDAREVAVPIVALPLQRGDEWYVLLEIHEPDAVVWRAYEWVTEGALKEARSLADKGQLVDEIDPAELMPDVAALGNRAWEHGLGEPTLVIARNDRDPLNVARGKSDYTRDLRDLQGEFEEKVSVMLRHFDELVNGGTTVLPQEAMSMVLTRGPRATNKPSDFGRDADNSNTLPTVDPSELNVIFEDGGNKGITRQVTRTPQYEGGMQALQLIISTFERLAGITLDHLLEQAKAPESGRAMRLSRTRDRKRILRKHRRFEGVFERAFELALRMDGIDAEVSYAFPEPFPMGEDERAEIAQMRVQGPTMSLERALQDIFNMSLEEAQEEAARIKGEQHAAGMQAGLGLFKDVAPSQPADFAEPDEGGE